LQGLGSRLVSSGAGPQRVTVVTARTDTTIVVQAEYVDAPTDYIATTPPMVAARLPVAQRLPVEEDSAPAPAARHPIQLYARTQRGQDPRAAPLVDVFA